MSEAARGRCWILAAAVLWSLGGAFIRYASREGLTPGAIACARSLVAGLSLAWALGSVRPALGGRFGAAAAVHTLTLLSYVMAVSLTSAAHAIFLQFLYPLLVAVGARLLWREPIGGRGAAALALGAAGVGVILAEGIGTMSPTGLALGLASAVCMGSFYLVQRGMTAGGPMGLASAYHLAAAAAMAPVALVQGLGGSTAGWAAVVVAGLVQHGVPYALFIRGLRMLPVSEAAILSLLEPVLNPIWVVLFLGEVPSETTIAGGALILGAVGVRVSKRVGE